MRLVDADEAVKIIKRYDDRGLALDEVTRVTDGIAREIEEQPTVDAEPVRHGKWINEPPYKAADGTYRKAQICSECNSYFVSEGNTPYSNHPYCCECGAKMDGE